MKLLDILKRDLETWPKGAAFAVQDRAGGTTVKFAGHYARPVGVALLGSEGVWQSNGWDFGTKGDFITELADDWDTARITETAWKGEMPPLVDDREQTRQAIIDLAAKQCGLSGDAIRQLATVLAAEGFRKFEIVEEDVWPISC